ncbi:hypothetical protein OGAPHI_001381 [Ogataea philodendri]|uniref:Uncharacterized protein n=1 Tax=Ogataea philodendri TaxID=1378263 RepID=A0A9P8T8J3_9ASCO|nr:uncharacterized protein OGAPHI_001381 [Ogataea philodendri]KAH3669260.1 hypothetical protein OGAPHI_001381 [Ogataea philodendri]
MSFDNNLEGYNIVKSFWHNFWNPNIGNFSTGIPCKESRDGKFSCWTMGVVLHAVAESCSVYRDMTRPITAPTVSACTCYRNPKYGAYAVLYHGAQNSGDDDINYDDCGHLVRGMIALYEATGNQEYLDLSKELMRFLMTGVVEHQKFHVKGLKWHISKKYMASISNCVAASGAMRLIPHSPPEEQKQLYEFAKLCVNFIWELMLDKGDNIVMDGCAYDSEGIDRSKYSYNTGNTLTAICLLYQYDKDPQWQDKAKKLAEAATDRGKTLFDRDYDDWGKRYWHGPSYFIQLMIEGLVDYLITFGQVAPESTRKCCENEILRHVSYFRKYMYDPSDGLYFCSFDIYKLDPRTYDRYRKEFGGHKNFSPGEDDRAKTNGDINSRPMCKSLIASAAAAHIFFQVARIFPKMDPVPV